MAKIKLQCKRLVMKALVLGILINEIIAVLHGHGHPVLSKWVVHFARN